MHTRLAPLTVAFLAACGGGGSGGAPDDPAAPKVLKGAAMHYREDGATLLDPRMADEVVVPLDLAEPVPEEESIAFHLSGTAVEGEHYELLTPSPLDVGAGEGQAEVVLRLLDAGRWFREKSIVIALHASPDAWLENDEVHVWIRPTDAPPRLRWSVASSAGGSGGNPHSLPLELSAPSGEDTTVQYVLGGSAVEGVDYRVLPGSESGLLTIPAGETSAELWLEVDPAADASGRTITVSLDHERDDGSDRNLYYNTHDWRLDVEAPQFPGEPYSSHVSGGNTTWKPGTPDFVIAESRAVDVIEQAAPEPKTAWDGHELQGIVQSEWLGEGSTGYIRLSFQGAQEAGLPTPMPTILEYTRVSVYVETFAEPDAWRDSRFVRIALRNRVKDMEHAVMFDRQAHTGLDADNRPMREITHAATGVWGIWKTEAWHPDDAAGVVEETIDGKRYTRLWYVHVSDSTTEYLNNKGRIATDDVGVDGMNVLFRFTYASQHDAKNGQDDSWSLNSVGGSVAGRGLLAFAPAYESSATPLDGPPGQFWERRGSFWGPRGNATRRAQEPTEHVATFTID